MGTKIFRALIVSTAACMLCMLALGGCIFDSTENGKPRISETVSFDGYIGVVQEYSVTDTGGEVTGDSIGLGFTTSEILIRVDTTQSSDGLVSISLEGDSIGLSFRNSDSIRTYKMGQAACKFTASATATIPNGEANVSAPLVFSQIFLSSTGLSLVIDEQKSKPSAMESVDFNRKAISGAYTISCPDPR